MRQGFDVTTHTHTHTNTHKICEAKRVLGV